MGSRRTMTRSFSGNGRSNNGDEISGSSRSGGCSYLSNVRPENRSTLCSVIAHLTEETQPSFETTLKSRAVSENSTVKFSCVVTGHPTPQVTWYKDDAQLDRYCGLPKYEIFRNGQNHSLHIYNCTVDDAAIYQASAANTKGIVSCSGVLEVGEMNEFKIHQRYFDKLKQKAENKRREAEGKENQEPLRTISPDRTLRKRRSTMDAFLSTPSSMEDEGNEENHQDGAMETKARLQETTVEKVEEKPVSITNGTVSPVTNGQDISEISSKNGTYVYDSAQKIFTALQPKTPFVKKKIKISNSAKVSSEEKRAKEEILTSGAAARAESTQSKEKHLEESMEVESVVTASVLNSGSRNVTDRYQKSARGERPSQDKSVCAEVTTASQREQLTASVPPVALTSVSHRASDNKGKRMPKQHKEAQHTDAEEHLETKDGNPCVTSKQQQSSVASMLLQPLHIVEEDISNAGDVTVMDVDEKSRSSTDITPRTLLGVPRKSRAALPQRPCEQAPDQLSETETSTDHRNVSVSQPVLVDEVMQAHAKMNRNDAPVNLELPTDQTRMEAPQKTPTETETTTHDIQTPSLHRGLQKAIDKMTQDTWDHSRGSDDSHTGLFTDLQKSPLVSPGGGENTPGCSVSPTGQESQVNTAIKTVEGTEIRVDEKVEYNKVGKLLGQSDSLASHEKKMKIESETAALPTTEPTKKEKTRAGDEKDKAVLNTNSSKKETEKTQLQIKVEEKTHSELKNLPPPATETATPHLTKDQETTNFSVPQIKDHKEIPTPVAKVISIAELLRAQLKALANSITMLPASMEHEPGQSGAETAQGFGHGGSKGKSVPDNKGLEETPPATIKATLLEIYNLLNKTDQELMLQDATVLPDQTSPKPPVLPPVSPTDSSSTVQSCSAVTEDKLTSGITPSLDVSETIREELQTPVKDKSQESIIPGLEPPKNKPLQDKDTKCIHRLTPEIQVNSESLQGRSEVNPTPVLEEKTNSCLQAEQRFPPERLSDTDTQTTTVQFTQQESGITEDFSSTGPLTVPTPEISPRLKKRTCVSPLPSATPQELASGARRKILTTKPKQQEETEDLTQKKLSPAPMTLPTSPSLSRHSTLLQPSGERTPPVDRRSPLQSRRKVVPEPPNVQRTEEIPKTEAKPAEKDKHDPFKAPQVIRKIRAETFADTSGHLKLWCQFFNILGESTIKWYRNEVEIAQTKRNAGDEAQVNLAIVQASSQDSGVYGCTITNEYGTDTTDFLLSAEILTGMSLREDLGVGEEIEMTPLIFNKGVADTCVWSNKFFGRIMVQESHIGDGCTHKVWKAKVIYGLEPVFESGHTCIMKACNPIVYGGKGETALIEKNLEAVKQECKIQNLAREYCKIFSAEARAIEHFGTTLEMIPVYLMYRPANTVPYATAEADLTGVYQKYSILDPTVGTQTRTGSEMEHKCCTLQHWIFQWTNGNLLFTRLEGVDNKITNVRVSVKSTGHQGLPIEGNPKVFEHFVTQHQCNYYCGLLGLKSLKVLESLLMPVKPKGSKSPLLQRKMTSGSSSPQPVRKAGGSPRMPRRAEQDGSKSPTKQKATDEPKERMA